jgi:hypothetical protein
MRLPLYVSSEPRFHPADCSPLASYVSPVDAMWRRIQGPKPDDYGERLEPCPRSTQDYLAARKDQSPSARFYRYHEVFISDSLDLCQGSFTPIITAF